MKSQEDSIEEKIRIKFFKKDEFKYLSHLDVSRLIMRALRRSGLKLKYSQGFNPKPLINFSSPIPLGLESFAEYADILLISEVDGQNFIDTLNNNLNPLLQVSAAKKIPPDSKSLMSQIDLNLYIFELDLSCREEAISVFEAGLKDKISGWDRSGSIFNIKFQECREPGGAFFIKIAGYAKIPKDNNNKIFKFSDFLDFFKKILDENGICKMKYWKEESYKLEDNILKTPMEFN